MSGPGDASTSPALAHTYLEGADMVKTTCSVDGCERAADARGWCKNHYEQWRLHGDHSNSPLRSRLAPGETLKWLLANYDADPNGPCVLWPFKVDKRGYGHRVLVNGIRRPPHSYATELRDGPAPEGMIAIHGPCHDVRCMIHVRWGTPAENAADRKRDGTNGYGESNRSAKLTTADVLEIRRRCADGETQRSVAARFGVNFSTVSLIVLRRKWGWLPD